MSGFPELVRWKVAEVVITTGEKRRKRFTEESERSGREDEDHEDASRGRAHTSDLCGAFELQCFLSDRSDM